MLLNLIGLAASYDVVILKISFRQKNIIILPVAHNIDQEMSYWIC